MSFQSFQKPNPVKPKSLKDGPAKASLIMDLPTRQYEEVRILAEFHTPAGEHDSHTTIIILHLVFKLRNFALFLGFTLQSILKQFGP